MTRPDAGTSDHVEEPVERATPEAAHDQPAEPALGLLRLQQLAGNRAVSRTVDGTSGARSEWAGPSGLDSVLAAGARPATPSGPTAEGPPKINRATTGFESIAEFVPAKSKIRRDSPITATPDGSLVQRAAITTAIGGDAETEAPGAAPAGAGGQGPGRAGRAKVKFSRQGEVETPIEAYSFGGVSPTGQGGMATGAIEMDSVILTRHSDDLSPMFVNALATNETFELVVKLQTDSAEGKTTNSTYTFGGARLKNLTQSGGSGAGTEQLSIDFASVDLEVPQGDDTAPVDAPAKLAVKGSVSGDFSVPVLSWDWAMTAPGGAGGGGQTQHAPVSMTIASTAECAMLLNAFSTNEILTTADLKPNSGPSYALVNARVTKFEHNATSGAPTAKIQLTYQSLGQQAGDRETHIDQTRPE